ncbi:MAG: hypothetical protein ACAH24_20685 [Hyphomicrobiaceae bacterium]|jgi:hypothetical protein
MPARASKTSTNASFGPYGAAEGYSHDELRPGERISPLPHRKSRALLRGAFLLAIFGGGWALLTDRVPWPDWQTLGATASSWMSRIAPSPQPTERASLVIAPPPRSEPPLRPIAFETAPQGLPLSATAHPAPAAPPPPATGAREEPQSEPLPPPAAHPSDPYRIRAEAVGLHPDLSRVLLDRLSETDYRNAGIAIRTALAETPDSGVHVWPRQRKPELALFQVRFVQGAAPACRRYVVTITKDGWLTTALPMEKCGATQAGRGSRKLASP